MQAGVPLTHHRLESLEQEYVANVQDYLQEQGHFDTHLDYKSVVDASAPPHLEALLRALEDRRRERWAGDKRTDDQRRLEEEARRRYPTRWLALVRSWYEEGVSRAVAAHTGAFLQAQHDAGRRAFQGAQCAHADLTFWDGNGRDGSRYVNCLSLPQTDLREADLRGASFYCGELTQADLRGADLRDADLRGTDLRRADLRGADLRGAHIGWDEGGGCTILHDAKLDGIELSGARIVGEPEALVVYLQARVVAEGRVSPCWGYASGSRWTQGRRSWREGA